MSLGTVVPIVGFIGFIVFMVMKGKKVHEKLLAESRKIAPEMGFTFNEDRMGYKEIPPDLLMSSFAKTYLGKLHNVNNVSVFNVFEKKEGSLTTFLFRYQHLSGGSSSHSKIHQTVACFVSPQMKLPRFRLAPKKSFSRLQSLLGAENMEFSLPGFRENNVVQGEDENAVRRLFSNSILSAFSNNRDLCVEGVDDVFLFYRHDVKVDPENLPDFNQDAERIFSMFYP